MTMTDQEISGAGRDVLVARVQAMTMELVAERATGKVIYEDLLSAKREIKALTDNVTALQEQSTQRLIFRRLDDALVAQPALAALVLDLTAALALAREKHPEGCSLYALMQEAGEAARALEREDEGRYRAELVDAATVTLRLLLREVDPRMAPRDPFAARSR